MKRLDTIHSWESLKVLADSRRLEILRLLMASPTTLTHLAQTMKRAPAWVRHHLLALESAGLIEVSGIRKTGKVTKKFYRAKAEALLLQEIILPKTKKPAVIFSGRHDLAVEGIAEHLQKHLTLLSLPVGSLDDLINLRQGFCHVSGSHLLDESGEYNTPFIRHLFPDRAMDVVTFVYRTQGLMLAKGNPKGTKTIPDLTQENIRFVNRNPGSGTRLWFDAELRRLKIPIEQIHGYNQSVITHSEAAAAVQSGKADAALGLQAAAYQHCLDFIPLFEERYDLVLPREREKPVDILLNYMQTIDFRKFPGLLPGYSTAHSGERIPI